MKQNKDGLDWHGTTIVLIRKNKDVVVAGDGQVSIGNTVMKSTAKKSP
jgi:ATP-dependent HslUV protease subunit HslV